MIIVMRQSASDADVQHVIGRLEDIGAEAHVSRGKHRTVIGAVGDREIIQQLPWEAFPGVERAVPVLKPFKFVSRDFQEDDSIVDVGGVPVGGTHFVAIAGPCAVESREQLFASAEAVTKAGARILRGDAFKPRTSPYSFQGLGEKGLELLAEARDEFGLPFVAEVVDPRDVELVAEYADLIRIGTRNMANFTLLSELGRQHKPVMLKRGFTATIEEWLNAAEYIYKEGNHNVILCERGIRTFETATRNTLDISAVPVVQAASPISRSSSIRRTPAATATSSPRSPGSRSCRGRTGSWSTCTPPRRRHWSTAPRPSCPSEFAELMDDVRALVEVMGLEL